jgi:glycosyltransferase involved in cell wall biosynthesis
MKIDLIFLTHNRLDYTRLSLASILADPTEHFSLTIWDNASTDGTVEYLRKEVRDPRIKEIVFSKENVGQTTAANKVWDSSDADLLGKLDNDCIMTPGWTRTLAQAHQDIPELGVVACWHFFPEDFDAHRAKDKIQQFGRHQIFRHPWTCGTGLLFKRELFHRFGPLSGGGTTPFWMSMAKAGCVNGFYYPLVLQEHMDDPRSKHNRSRSMTFEDAYKDSHGWKTGALRDVESWRSLHEKILENLLTGSFDPKHYDRPLWKRAVSRLKRTLSAAPK